VIRRGEMVKQIMPMASFPRYEEEIMSPYSAVGTGDENEAGRGVKVALEVKRQEASSDTLSFGRHGLQKFASHNQQQGMEGVGCMEEHPESDQLGLVPSIWEQKQQQCLQALLFDSIDFSSAAAGGPGSCSESGLAGQRAVSLEEPGCESQLDAAAGASAFSPAAVLFAPTAAGASPAACDSTAMAAIAAAVPPGSLSPIVESPVKQAVQQHGQASVGSPFAVNRGILGPAAGPREARSSPPQAAHSSLQGTRMLQLSPAAAASSRGKGQGQQRRHSLDRPAWGAGVPARASGACAGAGRGSRAAATTSNSGPPSRVGNRSTGALRPNAYRRASTGTCGVAALGAQASTVPVPVDGAVAEPSGRGRNMVRAAAPPDLGQWSAAGAAGGASGRDRVPRAKSACDLQQQGVRMANEDKQHSRKSAASTCRSVDLVAPGAAVTTRRPAPSRGQQVAQQQQRPAWHSCLSPKPARNKSKCGYVPNSSPIRTTWVAPRARANSDTGTAAAGAGGKAGVQPQQSRSTYAHPAPKIEGSRRSLQPQHLQPADATVHAPKKLEEAKAGPGPAGGIVIKNSIRLERTEGQLRIIPAESDR
jgi:hypothetical protein